MVNIQNMLFMSLPVYPPLTNQPHWMNGIYVDNYTCHIGTCVFEGVYCMDDSV